MGLEKSPQTTVGDGVESPQEHKSTSPHVRGDGVDEEEPWEGAITWRGEPIWRFMLNFGMSYIDKAQICLK